MSNDSSTMAIYEASLMIRRAAELGSAIVGEKDHKTQAIEWHQGDYYSLISTLSFDMLI